MFQQLIDGVAYCHYKGTMGTVTLVLMLVSVLVISPTAGEMSCDPVRMASKVLDTCNNIEVSTDCCETIETIAKLRCLRAVSQQQDVIDGGYTWGFLLDMHKSCQAKALPLNKKPDSFTPKPPSTDENVVTSSHMLSDGDQRHAAKANTIKKIKDIVVEGLEIVGSILGAVAGILVLWKKFRQQSGSTVESNEMLHTTRNPEPRAGGAPTQREAHGFVDTEVRHSCNYRMTRRTPTGEAALKDEKPNQRLLKTCLKPNLKLMKKQKVNCCDEHLFSRCPQRLEIFHFDGCCEQQEEAVVGDDGYCKPAPSP